MDVPAIDDPRIMVAVDLPKFDLTLRLPRFDFLPEAVLDKMDDQITVITDNEALNDRKKIREARLAMFKAVVGAKEYKILQSMTVGQLNLIYGKWADDSAVELGKYLASDTSSTENTEAPSNTISSSGDTIAATSDAA
jgi:hypothetical protein